MTKCKVSNSLQSHHKLKHKCRQYYQNAIMFNNDECFSFQSRMASCSSVIVVSLVWVTKTEWLSVDVSELQCHGDAACCQNRRPAEFSGIGNQALVYLAEKLTCLVRQCPAAKLYPLVRLARGTDGIMLIWVPSSRGVAYSHLQDRKTFVMFLTKVRPLIRQNKMDSYLQPSLEWRLDRSRYEL